MGQTVKEAESKFQTKQEFAATGVIGLDPYVVLAENQLRVVVEGVGGGNTILVQGKVRNGTNYQTLATINGASSGTTVDVSTYDHVRFNCSAYAASGTPTLLVSGFFSKAASGGGSGETNTASNQGASGVGVFDGKVGVDLQFRNVNAASNKVTVVLDGGNKEIDIDVDPSNIDIADLDQVGTLNNGSLLGTDSSGEVESMDGWQRTSGGGLNCSQTVEPAGGSGGNQLNIESLNVNPTANSDNISWTLKSFNGALDTAGAGFNIGTNGQALTLVNYDFNHQGTSDTGHLIYQNMNSSLGNGSDPISIKGVNFIQAYTNIAANVEIDGPIYGFLSQLNYNSSSTTSANHSHNTFADFTNMPCASGAYQSITATPIISEIKNNANYSGFNLAPTITTFTGNAGFTGIGVSPDITTMGTGGFFGINVNPTVSSCTDAYGIYVNMNNVTASGNKLALSATGDVSIIGSLSFTGALSVGQFSSFYAVAPVNSGSPNPTTLHSMITSVTSVSNEFTSSADTIGVNTATLTTMNSGSTVIAGAFGLGLTALALPCVTTTHTNSYLSDMTMAGYALSLDGTSTGGTIDVVHACRAVGVPNGVTTINHFRAFEFNLPFGGVATQTHGLWLESGDYSWMSHGLKIGGSAPGAATGTWSTTSAITLTDRAKGTARNTETITLQVAAAAANPTDTILAVTSGTSAARVLTITPNDGTNNGATPVDLTTAELVQLINEGLVTGKNVTVTDTAFYLRDQSASGGDATNLANGGEGDGLVATFSGGTAGTDVVDSGVRLQIEGGDIKLAALDVQLDTTTGTKIGTSTSQKIGFYNATPIVQPTSSGSATAGAAYGATEQSMLQEVYDAVRALGLMS